MNELQSKEIYDSAGNVIPEIADKLELASSIYYLLLQYSKDDCTLKTEVSLNRAVVMQLQSTVKVSSVNDEKALETISVAAQILRNHH